MHPIAPKTTSANAANTKVRNCQMIGRPIIWQHSIAVTNFGVCDFSRWAVTDWRLRRWRLWFLALMTATRLVAFVVI